MNSKKSLCPWKSHPTCDTIHVTWPILTSSYRRASLGNDIVTHDSLQDIQAIKIRCSERLLQGPTPQITKNILSHASKCFGFCRNSGKQNEMNENGHTLSWAVSKPERRLCVPRQEHTGHPLCCLDWSWLTVSSWKCLSACKQILWVCEEQKRVHMLAILTHTENWLCNKIERRR